MCRVGTLLLLLPLLLVASCRTSREQLKVEQVDQVERKAKLNRAVQTRLLADAYIDTDTDVEVIRITYDTDKPICRETKRPPVAEEVKLKVGKSVVAKREQLVDRLASNQERVTSKGYSRSEGEQKRKSGLPWYRNSLLLVGIGVLIAASGYLSYRIKRRK